MDIKVNIAKNLLERMDTEPCYFESHKDDLKFHTEPITGTHDGERRFKVFVKHNDGSERPFDAESKTFWDTVLLYGEEINKKQYESSD